MSKKPTSAATAKKAPTAKAPAAAPKAAAADPKKKPPAEKKQPAAPAAADSKKKVPVEKKQPAAAAPVKAKEEKPEAPPAAAAPAKPKESKKESVKKATKKAAAAKKPTGKQVLRGKSSALKKKKATSKFVIDCTLPAEDQLFNSSDFEKFLRERIKINGKTGQLGNALSIEKGEKSKIIVNANIAFSKRYLKYLTKKYLKKNLLRDTLRVISTGKDVYELRYFQIGNEGEEDEEDNE